MQISYFPLSVSSCAWNPSPSCNRSFPPALFSVRAAMILRRPPQAAHSLMSEENTRAGRVAHRSRWPQDGALSSPSAAGWQPAWPARCGGGLGPGGPGHRGSVGEGAGAGDQSRQLLQYIATEIRRISKNMRKPIDQLCNLSDPTLRSWSSLKEQEGFFRFSERSVRKTKINRSKEVDIDHPPRRKNTLFS